MNMYHGAGKLSFEARERNAKRDQIARDEARYQVRKAQVARVMGNRRVQQVLGVTGMLGVVFGVGTIETMEI